MNNENSTQSEIDAQGKISDTDSEFEHNDASEEAPLVAHVSKRLKFKGKNLLSGIVISQILEKPMSERPENKSDE